MYPTGTEPPSFKKPKVITHFKVTGSGLNLAIGGYPLTAHSLGRHADEGPNLLFATEMVFPKSWKSINSGSEPSLVAHPSTQGGSMTRSSRSERSEKKGSVSFFSFVYFSRVPNPPNQKKGTYP